VIILQTILTKEREMRILFAVGLMATVALSEVTAAEAQTLGRCETQAAELRQGNLETTVSHLVTSYQQSLESRRPALMARVREIQIRRPLERIRECHATEWRVLPESLQTRADMIIDRRT
jgi:hypothetical protein